MPKKRSFRRPHYTCWATRVAINQALEEKKKAGEQFNEKDWFFKFMDNLTQLSSENEGFEELKQLYKTTGNPLYLWEMYRLTTCLRNRPRPDYVIEYMKLLREYFDNVMEGLLNNKKNQLSDCAEHLGFNLKDGGRNPFKQFHDERKRARAIEEVTYKLFINPGMNILDACNEVAEKNPDFEEGGDTIYKWYHTVKR